MLRAGASYYAAITSFICVFTLDEFHKALFLKFLIYIWKIRLYLF